MSTEMPSFAPLDGSIDNNMRDLAAAIVMAMRQPKQLSSSQQSVELKFRLIRNGLGNYGGHGDDSGDRALIRMIQDRDDEAGCDVLIFQDALPARAYSVVVHAVGDRFTETRKLTSRHKVEVQTERIAMVEFLDEFGVTVAAGIPVKQPERDDATVRRTTKTTTSK